MSTTKDRAARARDIGQPGGGGRPRALVPVLAVIAVVVVAIVVALATSGNDGSSTDVAGGPETPLATAGITVRGEPLPPLDGGADPAVGAAAPTLEGVAPDGTPTNVDPTGQPTLLAFLAHWCPHCQAELPRLVDLAGSGGLDGIRAVTVLTGTDPSLPNYPPAPWLEREGWSGDVILDDEASTAASAYGLSSYPFLVLLDADGQVIARSAGELSPEELQDFVAQAG